MNIDWRAFLDGAALQPDNTRYSAEHLETHGAELSVSTLVHVVKLIHEAGSTSQDLPSSAELVDQLRKMRRAAAQRSHLAQGGDGEGQPIPTPEWFKLENGIDVNGEGPRNLALKRANPDVHSMIHELLHRARAFNFSGGFPQGLAEHRTWREVGLFFTWLRLGLQTLDDTIEQIQTVNDVSEAPANRPADDARRWALTRLLWICTRKPSRSCADWWRPLP